MSFLSRFGFRPSLIFVISLITACGSFVNSPRPLNAEYCDSFLIYEMCAMDTNRDGVVDLVYFTDSKEVFMYHPEFGGEYPSGLELHRCATPMDEELVATTNRVFYVDDSTPFLERQDIKGEMMLKYVANLPEITACNLRAEQKESDK
ncbi:MAG: hypothetical protein CMQ45_06635 [Gammaproteobacteria bacterium]|nr:hypothetical protein [Gammaproteobacteria bacterium]